MDRGKVPRCPETGTKSTIIGGDDNDSLDGGTGFDQARFRVAVGDFTVRKDGDVYTIVSAEDTDTVTNVEEFVFGDTTLSAAQMDALAGTGNLFLFGGSGDDTITSGRGDDTINAGDGDDTIIGGRGSDFITSGDGNDEIRSDDGDDTIWSGDGDDTIWSGDGNELRPCFRTLGYFAPVHERGTKFRW